MKTTITAILTMALVLSPLHATEPDREPVKSKPSVPDTQTHTEQSYALAALVLVCAAVGAFVVLKVHSKHKQLKGPVTLVLEKSTDNVNWTPVFTNNVVINGEQPIDFFQEVRRDGYSFYRARVQKENFTQ